MLIICLSRLCCMHAIHQQTCRARDEGARVPRSWIAGPSCTNRSYPEHGLVRSALAYMKALKPLGNHFSVAAAPSGCPHTSRSDILIYHLSLVAGYRPSQGRQMDSLHTQKEHEPNLKPRIWLKFSDILRALHAKTSNGMSADARDNELRTILRRVACFSNHQWHLRPFLEHTRSKVGLEPAKACFHRCEGKCIAVTLAVVRIHVCFTTPSGLPSPVYTTF